MTSLSDIWSMPEAVFVIKLFFVVCLIVFAVYTVLKIRGFAAGTMPKTGEYVTEFESMREQGLIDDKELSQVKSVVGTSVDDSTNDNEVDDNFED